MYNTISKTFSDELASAYKPLDQETELKLIIQAQKGSTSARNKLVNSQLFQIKNTAIMYAKMNSNNEVGDLIAYGIMGYTNQNGKTEGGLYKAIDTFDITLGTRLITWAGQFIRNAIRDASMKNQLVPNTAQKSKAHKSEDLTEKYQEEADLYGMTLEKYVDYKNMRGENIDLREDSHGVLHVYARAEKFTGVSFDAPVGSDESTRTLEDVMPDENVDIDGHIHRADIMAMVNELPEHEREAICAIYGINCDGQSARKVALEIGVSHETVNNRHKAGMAKLQRMARKRFQEG